MLRELFALIVEVSSYQWSGKIDVVNPVAGLSWQLFFSMGHLVWVDGGMHPRRRYRRHFKSVGTAPTLEECLTSEARLQHAISCIQNRQIGSKGLQGVLQASAREIFFDISQACSGSLKRDNHGHFSWHENARPNREFVLPTSWGVNACFAFKDGRRDWQHWGKVKLSHQSPDMSPVVLNADGLAEMLSPKTFDRTLKLFSSNRTLRDISMHSSSMHGIGRLQEIADFIKPLLRNSYLALDASPDYGDSDSPAAFEYLKINGLECAAADTLAQRADKFSASVEGNADMKETLHELV